MATVAAPSIRTTTPYPAAAVAAILREELLRAVRARCRRKGQSLPKEDADVVILVVEIDSLTIVELLSALDDVLPFQVTECVVKAGGYDSIEAAVKHVVGRIQSKWNKHHGVKP